MQPGVVREEALRAILALAVPEADDSEPEALPDWVEHVDPDQVLWHLTCFCSPSRRKDV